MKKLRSLQAASRSRTTSHTTFTGDDAERNKCRIEALTSTKRDNKFKLSDKKALASRVYDHTDEIEADIMAVDPVGNLSLEGKFNANLETISSKNRIKNMSNDSLAQWFVNIYPIVDAINSGLVELHRAARSTRQSSENNSSGSKFTSAQVLYNNIIDTMKVIDTQVGEAAAISGSKSNRFSFLKRLPSMLGLTYDILRRPNDSKNHECVVCHHMSIIHPIEDDGHVERNRATQAGYDKRLAAWSKYEAAKNEAIQNSSPGTAVQMPPYPVVEGKTLTRAPSKPTKSTLGQPTSLCTCLSNSCGNPNDDVGSSCPIRCRKLLEDDPMFDMSDPMLLASNPFAVRMEWINEGRKAVCPCEYCMCQCTAYYNTSDTARIGHGLLQVTNTQESTDDDQAAVANLVSQQFSIANLGWDAIRAGNNNTRDMSLGYEEHMNMSIADGIARSGAGSNRLDSMTLRRMQQDYGSGTVVRLPSGHNLDKRVVTQPPNKHATNNRIHGAAHSGPSQEFASGMSSNLQIDYTTLDERFISETQHFTSLSDTMFGAVDHNTQARETNRGQQGGGGGRGGVGGSDTRTTWNSSLSRRGGGGGGGGGGGANDLSCEREDRHLLRGSGDSVGYSGGSAGAAVAQSTGKRKSSGEQPDILLSQPESEESLPLMKKIRTSNTRDLLETKMNKREVPLTDEEVRAGQMLQNGVTRLYGRLGSKKKEYDPLLKTIIEDIDNIYPDLHTPEKTNAVRLLLVDHVTKEDDTRKRDDDGID